MQPNVSKNHHPLGMSLSSERPIGVSTKVESAYRSDSLKEKELQNLRIPRGKKKRKLCGKLEGHFKRKETAMTADSKVGDRRII